jgi:hypothetical protein
MSTDPTSTTGTPDPSPYIRTYAKDVAALTGQKPPPTGAKIPTDEISPPTPENEPLIVSEAPSKVRADLPKLQREMGKIGSGGETEQEAEERIQDIGGASSSGLLQSISLPHIKPGDIIPGITQIPVATSETAEREAVLARLRAKVATQPRISSTPMMPSASISMPARVPVSTPEPPPIPAPKPVPTPPPSVEEGRPSPFHSFSSDFADRIDEQHASTFSVLAAEKDAAPPAPLRQKPRSSLLPILAGIVLIIAGASGIFIAYRFMSAAVPIPATPSAGYIIVPDEKVELTGSGTTLLNALAQQASQPIPANTVLLTYITAATTTKTGVAEAPASGGAFLTALNLTAPDILLRNVEPSSMVGIINDGTQTRTFFILRVDSYESTFAGMLDWESTIASDLDALYPAYPVIAQTAPVATTSSITTAKATTPVVVGTQPQFLDEVVDNHNARALKDAEGRTIIIYGYADNQTLIIARNEAAFTLLLGRLQTSQQ